MLAQGLVSVELIEDQGQLARGMKCEGTSSRNVSFVGVADVVCDGESESMKKARVVIDGCLGSAPMVRGTLRPAALAGLQKICAECVVDEKVAVKQDKGKSLDFPYIMNPRIKGQRANGSHFKRFAPSPLQQFFAGIPDCNPELYVGLQELENMTLPWGSSEISVWDGSPKDACFAYATVKHFPFGECTTAWHVHGGPSTIFLAIAVKGRRKLEVEDKNKVITEYEQKEGDWYVSSPSCFWHRVVAMDDGKGPVTSLILRSAVLSKMISGGRERENGTRTSGLKYNTGSALKQLTSRFAELLEQFGFTLGGLEGAVDGSTSSIEVDGQHGVDGASSSTGSPLVSAMPAFDEPSSRRERNSVVPLASFCAGRTSFALPLTQGGKAEASAESHDEDAKFSHRNKEVPSFLNKSGVFAIVSAGTLLRARSARVQDAGLNQLLAVDGDKPKNTISKSIPQIPPVPSSWEVAPSGASHSGAILSAPAGDQCSQQMFDCPGLVIARSSSADSDAERPNAKEQLQRPQHSHVLWMVDRKGSGQFPDVDSGSFGDKMIHTLSFESVEKEAATKGKKRERTPSQSMPEEHAKREKAGQFVAPHMFPSEVSRVPAHADPVVPLPPRVGHEHAEAAGVGGPHSSGARWSSHQLQAWAVQLPHHTKDTCPKAGKWYVCATCGRRDKRLVSMEKSACPGFTPDPLISTKLRKCITWCRKCGSSPGSSALRADSSMAWLLEHQVEVIPVEVRFPPQVPPSVATAEGDAQASFGMLAPRD